MRRALLIAFLLAGCKQQDAALSVHMHGAFRIPQDADTLAMDVFDGQTVIKHVDWCFNTAGCQTLPGQASLDETVTLVESGASHPNIKINLQLSQGPLLVGLGTNTASFQDGATEPVDVQITRPQ